MSIPVTNLPGTLPFSCYPADPQDLNLAIVAGMQSSVNMTFGGVIISPTAPGPSYYGQLWFRSTDFQLFSWITAVAAWARPHSMLPSSDARILFVGLETALWAFDGGDGNDPAVVVPGDAVGAMWERDTAFDARMPIGIGTMPVAGAVAVLGTGGAETHLLTVAELPSHTHPNPSGSDGFYTHSDPLLSGTYNVGAGADTKVQTDTGATGGGTAFSVMPPYIGVIVAKRTARKYILA